MGSRIRRAHNDYERVRKHTKEVPKDFLVEMPFEKDKNKATGNTETKLENTRLSDAWKLYTDRALSSDGSGARLMLNNHHTIQSVTNSAGNGNWKFGNLRRLPANGKPDKGCLRSKASNNQGAPKKAKEVLRSFNSYTIEHIRRNQNKKADTLRKLASMTVGIKSPLKVTAA
ncbi:hypothetical protein Tco_0694946 [Tanacetum coccineum]